jgi:Holliday junction resolvase RusA-like endonuclease
MTEQQLADHLARTGIPGARNTANVSSPPFALPQDVMLDLPIPISVNALRRVDWSSMVRTTEWKRQADALVMVAKRRPHNPLKFENIQRFEITLTFDERQTGIDLDNGIKGILDYLVLVEVIENDAPKNMRRLVVEWGEAPTGARATIRPCA